MLQTLPDAVVLFDFELMLNSLVNSYCHIETLTPFYGTFAQRSDAMTSKQCFKYATTAYTYGWFDFKTIFLVRLRPERLTSNKMVSK